MWKLEKQGREDTMGMEEGDDGGSVSVDEDGELEIGLMSCREVTKVCGRGRASCVNRSRRALPGPGKS